MNNILKLHHSSGLLAGSLVNNTKFYKESYICGHCLRRHGVIRNNVQEHSTYVSALKLMLKRKETLKKSENKADIKLLNKIKWSKRKNNSYITEILKVTSRKSLSTKMTIQQIKPSEVKAFAEQPGMTFSKIKAIKESNSKLLTANHREENVKSKSPKAKFSTTETQRGSIENINSYSNLGIESNLNLSKMNVKVDEKWGKNQNDIKKIDKDSNANLISVSTLSNEISPRIQKNSTKSELDGFFLGEPQEEINSDLQLLNLLNVEPSISNTETEEKEVSYMKERTLLPYCIQNSKKFILSQFLNSYLDICIINNNIKDALIMLHSCRSSSLWRQLLAEDKNVVGIYNTILKALSEEGNWNFVQLMIKWMETDQVKLNSESFAHIFYCLKNESIQEFQNDKSKKTEVMNILNKLMSSDISLNDIFAKTKLTKEKTEKILSLFRNVFPSFEIKPTFVELNSGCNLLKNLHSGPNRLKPFLGNNFSTETMENLVEEQFNLEKNLFVPVEAVYKGNCTEEEKKEVEKLKEIWRKQIHNGFVKKLKLSKESETLKKFNIHLYLKCLPVEMYVNIMMQLTEELVEYPGGYSPSSVIFCRNLGQQVYQCYQVHKKVVTGDFDKTKELFKKYSHWYLHPDGPARNTRQEWQMLSQDSNGRCLLDRKFIKWPEDVLVKVGQFLYEIIISEVKFTRIQKGQIKDTIPVFYTILRNKNENYEEEVKCHPVVSKLFQKIGFNELKFPAHEMPMLCPPKPWKAPFHGGYLMLHTDFIRSSTHVSGKSLNLNVVPVQQLYATFDSLNALQAIPWVVNEDVLDVALNVFRNGGSEKLSVPGLPKMEPVAREITEGMSLSERFQQYKKVKEIMNERKNEYGLWCNALYKLSLANHFRNRVFWLPQNCDFRGRVYPVPPHLNHLGADFFRSLLLFAHGKPLGPEGLNWLKIHAINLTGTHKKKSVKERLEYANEILSDILDSAEKPLEGKRWWMESEEPWQTLAACKEIRKAMSSPNPELYVCQFPIHQDGSCNGLQHYAALGRDVIGAKSVNLTPCDTPQDVYSVVADIVEQKREEDAQNGIVIAQKLNGFIGRKVVKQTVMTTVYGVTKYGAKLQIAKRLEELPNFPKEDVLKAAVYLSEKTFQSLNQMFCSAKEIQDWFIKCAHEICKRNDYVQWTTPLGLPVLQSYAKKSRSKTKLQKIYPDTMKQKNAFPPNFIHSLDSSHMMLTALYCEQAGITFAAIHDCFWTHPRDVQTLNKICREQFVSLHSQEILRDLSFSFRKNFIQETEVTNPEDERVAQIFDSVPKTGDFSLEQVLNSVYFFS